MPSDPSEVRQRPQLSDFDRDTVTVAINLARQHDPTLTEVDAQPIFLADVPGIVLEATGRSLSPTWLRLLRLSGKLPRDRGRVAGKPFWLRRDVIAWASERR